ncbi:limbic system-associated membrane protein-like [Panonychus citri]|uniref:limbic system-associated membrane protein-like n=1 Tax=Panonychus citri TaxID=50023 RepID=UPI0023083679|nr:limbic system-associated membrane protein-like [Panonychus citri]
MVFEYFQSTWNNLNELVKFSKFKNHVNQRDSIVLLLIMLINLVNLSSSKHLLVSNINSNNQGRPEFIQSVPNLSIITGKDAIMRCSVKNLGKNIISWHHLESNSDLTINKQILSSNPRIKIRQEKDDWLLIISNVSLEDRGFYICRINWLEPKSQLGYLNVVEPPRIDESSFTSGSEKTVRENSNLTLTCRASGNPSPTIEWRREDGRAIHQSSPSSGLYPESSGVPKIIGDELSFNPITRWNMGSYLCIASNSIPPSVSRRIMIYVQFAPVIRIPSVSVTGTKGANVTLQCSSESSPIADHIWLDQNDSLLGSSLSPQSTPTIRSKYVIQLIKTYHFKVTYQLTIIDLDYNDTGRYICFVNNTLGLARSSIFLQVKDYQKPVDSNSISAEDSDESESVRVDLNSSRQSTTESTNHNNNNNRIASDIRFATYPDDTYNQPNKDSASSMGQSMFLISILLLTIRLNC